MESSGREHWSGVHFLLQGVFLTRGSALCLFHLLQWRGHSSPLGPPVQSLGRVRLCDPADCSHQVSLSFTNFWSLLKLTTLESLISSNHLVFIPSPPDLGVFSSELALCINWPSCWSFSFNISPSHGYSGLISFRIDWLDLLRSKGLSRGIITCAAFLHLCRNLRFNPSAFSMTAGFKEVTGPAL